MKDSWQCHWNVADDDLLALSSALHSFYGNSMSIVRIMWFMLTKMLPQRIKWRKMTRKGKLWRQSNQSRMLALKGTSQTRSDSDDDKSVIEPTPLGLIDCCASYWDFIITLDDSGERERKFPSSLSAMEDAFSGLQIKQMRQTKLEEYLKGALSQEFCCFQLHSFLKSLPGTFTHSQNAQMD